MAAYIGLRDLYPYIQTDNLQQLQSDTKLRNAIINASIEEVKAYIAARFDLVYEFTRKAPQDFSFTTAYLANNVILLDAQGWLPSETYNVNTTVSYQGKVYICTQLNSNTIPTNVVFWTLIGSQYDYYTVKLPYPEFNYNQDYNAGVQVWWKDKTYTAQQAITDANEAPDQNATLWGVGTSYSVTNELPSNATYFELVDSRSQKLVMCCVDITLYHLHARISPRNIPQLRADRRDEAISWVKMASKGESITLNAPMIKPEQGSRIRWGSNSKLENYY